MNIITMKMEVITYILDILKTTLKNGKLLIKIETKLVIKVQMAIII